MKPLLVCLHGWGGTKESFIELRHALKSTAIEILAPDLPGFGTALEPDRPWSVDDYADWVEKWIRNQKPITNNQKLHLLGHSHGSRIAIKIAARRTVPIEHLYLCAAAGIRHQRHFKRIIGLTLAKSGKALVSIPGLKHLEPFGRKFLYKLIRVHDYEKASPVMRETMIRVSAEDLRGVLPKITVPTDLFWGEDDRMTPVSDGHLMNKAIVGSILHTYVGIRHAVHRDKAREIAGTIRARMEGA